MPIWYSPVLEVTADSPLASTEGNEPNLTIQQANASQSGALSASDWNTFNNKLDASRFNYITNPGGEVDAAGWNLYNNVGRTEAAYYVDQDITWIAVASGNAGNGINIQYVFHPSQSYLTPLVTVVSPVLVTVGWYNGPSIANNPTATQLKAAWDAVPGALALATCTITGTASDLQYINGSHVLGSGGDTAPTNGTGGVSSGLTFTRNTTPPILSGTANLLLSKDSTDQLGQGVSTDFQINSADGGNPLQVSFYYSGDAGMVFGNSSDIQVFLYDVTNGVMKSLTRQVLSGPTANVIYRFAAQFTAAVDSVNYRLILHVASSNAATWNIKLDEITVSPVLDAAAATEVPKIVIPAQPILISVTDHMAVMWQDGNTSWRPATMTSGSDSTTLWGFAINIVGLTADIVVRGYLDGFSVGPFLGYNQYVGNISGSISPLPSPFTDTGVVMGKGVAEDAILVAPVAFTRLVTSKGGLLTNAGANNGTGDQVLAVGSNGTVPVANSAAALGIQWLGAVVTGNGFTYTTATRTLVGALTGDVTGALTATAISATTVTGKVITGYVSGAGTVAATDTILQAIQKLNGNIAGKQTTTLTSANILVGNVSNVATAVAMSGDITIDNVGVTVIGTNKITNAKAAQMAAHTFKGNNTGSTANALDLTAAQLSAELNSSIVNSSAVTGATVTDALNTLNQAVQEVLLSAIKNGGAVTANTTIPSWTTTSKDSLTGFNPTTGVYTVQAPGDLLVAFTAAITIGTATAQVYKNGVLVQTGLGPLLRTMVTTVVPNCIIGDTITVAIDSSSTLTSVNTDTTLNIYQLAGATSQVVNARYHSATATVTSSLSNITWTVKDKDSANAYSGVTYTIPSNGAGMYHVFGSIAITATTVAAGQAQILTLNRNGSEIARYTFIAGAATQKPNILTINDFYSFSGNDTLTFQVSSASTVPVVSASATQNRFFLYKVSN